MKGYGFQAHGDLSALRWVDIATPEPGPGEVRVAVRAAALNHLDRFVLRGIPGVPIERPHVIGSDAAGLVERTGPGVETAKNGQKVLVNPGMWDGTCDACRAGRENFCRAYRILGEHTQGSFAPFVVVPARNVYPLPDSLGFEAGASFPLVFQTAWRAIVTVGEVRSGETVAVIGAGGGVATAVIQVARLKGARVVVVSRSAEKAERTKRLGAEAVIVPTPERPMERELWEWSGKKGIDIIFDSVGADTLPHSVKALARGGRAVVIGATSGNVAPIELNTLYWRQASIRGSTMASRCEFEAMLAEVSAGRLKPVIDAVFPWEDAPKAFPRFLAPDLFGKVVLQGPAAAQS